MSLKIKTGFKVSTNSKAAVNEDKSFIPFKNNIIFFITPDPISSKLYQKTSIHQLTVAMTTDFVRRGNRALLYFLGIVCVIAVMIIKTKKNLIKF